MCRTKHVPLFINPYDKKTEVFFMPSKSFFNLHVNVCSKTLHKSDGGTTFTEKYDGIFPSIMEMLYCYCFFSHCLKLANTPNLFERSKHYIKIVRCHVFHPFRAQFPEALWQALIISPVCSNTLKRERKKEKIKHHFSKCLASQWNHLNCELSCLVETEVQTSSSYWLCVLHSWILQNPITKYSSTAMFVSPFHHKNM